MLQLVKRLLERRSRRAQDGISEPVGIPVPVSVVGWDGALSLQTWLIGRLRNAYNLPKRRARALVEGGYILPVLDGLDEATDPGTDPRPIMRILHRLNFDYGAQSKAGGHPLVLTCREHEYANLPSPNNDQALDKRVLGAPVIVLSPLNDNEVRDARHRAVAAFQAIGLPFPPPNWPQAWAHIAMQARGALGVIREEINANLPQA